MAKRAGTCREPASATGAEPGGGIDEAVVKGKGADTLLGVIMTRRSVRDFKQGNVLPGDLEKILLAGIMAPSPGNRQPWRFHVMRGSAKDKFVGALRNTATLTEAFRRLFVEIMETVPVVVAVENPGLSGVRSVSAPGSAIHEIDTYSIGGLMGTAASVENMLLAIHSLGYGSVWIGLPPILEAARTVVDIEGELVGILPIGHPADEQTDYVDRSRKPLEDVARFYE